MRASCSVFIATSLDGFISRPDGSIGWLDDANKSVPAGEDCGFAAFMGTVDALVMGRRTFEQVLTFDPWPYGPTPVVVMSRTLKELPPKAPGTVTLTDETPTALVERLHTQGLRHLYVDGGQTIQSFMAEKLIQNITITVVPVLLGQGRPLFGAVPADVHLQHVSTRAYPFGFVQNVYRVK